MKRYKVTIEVEVGICAEDEDEAKAETANSHLCEKVLEGTYNLSPKVTKVEELLF